MGLRTTILALIAVLAVITAGAAVAVYWLLHTESGRDAVITRVEAELPAGSRIGAADGVLAGPLTLRDSRIVTDDAIVEVARARVEWSPAALLQLRVEILRLEVEGVDLDLVGEGRDGGGAALPEFPPVPLTVMLADGVIGSVMIAREGRPLAGPVQVEVAGRLDRQRLALHRFVIDAPWGGARGHGSLAMQRPHATQATLAWHGQPPAGIAALAGTLQLGGNLEQLETDLRVERPQALRVQGRLRPFVDGMDWDLAVSAPLLHSQAWLEAVEPVELQDVDLHLAGRQLQAELAGRAVAVHAEAGRAWFDVNARVDAGDPGHPVVDLQRLHLRSDRIAGSMDASGRLEWPAGGPHGELELAWQDIAAVVDEVAIRSPGGQLSIRGSTEHYRIDGSAGLQVADLPAADWQLRGTGDLHGLQVTDLVGQWFGAAWSASGHVDWRDGIDGSTQFALYGLDPMVLDIPVVGSVDLVASADWSLAESGEPRISARLDRVGGQLGGQDLGGGGGIELAGDVLSFDGFHLRAGEASLELDGRLLPQPRTRFALDVPELAGLVQGAEGSLRATGRISGQLPYPSVHLRVDAGELVWQDYAVREIHVRADLPTDPDSVAQLDLDARALRLNGPQLDALAISLDGTVADHTLDIRAEADDVGTLQARIHGQAADPPWTGSLERLWLELDDHVDWRLAAPAAMRLGFDRVALETACLLPASSPAHLDPGACGRFSLTPDGGWQVNVDADNLPLAFLAYWLGPEVIADGSVDVALEAGAAIGAPASGRLRLRTSPGSLSLVEDEAAGERIELLAWQAGRVEASMDADAIDADLDLPLVPDGELRARVRITRGVADPHISGWLTLDSARLALLGRLVPEVGRVDGRLTAAVQVDSPLSRLAVDGRVDLADGRISIPRLGIVLEDLRMELAGEEGVLRGRIGASSGDGRVEASIAALREADGWRFEGGVAGEDVLVLNTPDGRLRLSPDVDWRLRGRHLRLDGRIHVPFADIHPRDYSGAVRPTGDATVIVADGAGDAADDEWRIEADVEVTMGDEVRFRGFGLRGRLAGSLHIRERPGELTSATGELEIHEGIYRAYRQELQIERGRLIYDGGPLLTPGLDIRAVRYPRNVMVGVAVRGTLQHPTLELFSDPPMQESQVVSYLVLGMPLREADQEDQTALAAATAGAGWVTDQYGGLLGIDEVTVREGASPDETELVLGTWLSPRLYVSYGMGLFESFARMRMRYLLTQRWAVEAESGPTSSADLIFTIER